MPYKVFYYNNYFARCTEEVWSQKGQLSALLLEGYALLGYYIAYPSDKQRRCYYNILATVPLLHTATYTLYRAVG